MASSSDADVQRSLDQLRENPVGSDLPEETLKQIYEYLMAQSTSDDLHWFCGKATTTTVAAATFSFRLHAYDSENVTLWKKKLVECLSKCTECVHAEERAKIMSRNTYLGAYLEDVKTQFFLSFEHFEAQTVVDILARAGLSTTSSSVSSKSLFDVPPALAYRMVSNFGVFRDERILAIIDKHPPPEPLFWPLDLLPAGMLLLLLHRNPLVREWATKQVAKCTAVPLPNDSFNGPYSEVLKVISSLFSPPANHFASGGQTAVLLQATFVSDPEILWSSLPQVLKLIPPESLVSGSFQHVDMRRVVTGHLHDTGPEFAVILQCFTLLIKRLGSRIWLGEGPEYPQVVFDSIKDNPSFITRIQESGGDRRNIIWFREYLVLISDASIHSQVCLKMLSFLCEELQHERFGDSRATVMSFAAFLMKSEDKNADHKAVVSEAFRIHGEVLTSVAFSKAHAHARWSDARSQTRDLISSLMTNDLKALTSSLAILCETLAARRSPAHVSIAIREHIWKAVYTSLQNDDSDGVHLIISVMAEASHLDNIHTAPFQTLLANPLMDKLFRQLRGAIPSIKTGFFEAVSSYCDRSSASTGLALLQKPGMVKAIMKLMLSPVDSLRMSAQAIVGLAFDVDAPAECFRILLEKHTAGSLEGIFDFLSTFKDHANVVPEACSLAKSLVRGFTDIMEVLCTQPGGLLHQPSFLQATETTSPALQLPKLWTMMSHAIALIFKRTPTWAKYFDNDMMILWMRDALIFGREMLSEVTTFQSAARSVSKLSSDRRKDIDNAMLNDMQQVLTDLARWLRLTDDELLHQSYSLLEALFDYFRENGTKPNTDTLDRLKRYLKDATQTDVNAPRTRLSSNKLKQLDLLLASFHEVIDIPDDDDDEEDGAPPPTPIVISDDEVEVVPVTKTTKPKRPAAPSPIPLPPPETRKSKPPKPSTSTLPPKRAPYVPPQKKSNIQVDKDFFGERDQKRLANASSAAKFSRSSAGPSKPRPSVQHRASSGRSSPSGDDDDDDGEEESQATAIMSMGGQQLPKVKKRPAHRGVKLMEEVPSYVSAANNRLRQQREEAERQAAKQRAYRRHNPNSGSLFRILLTWNYDHDGPAPPGPPLRTMSVPDQFKEHREYLSVFEPLILHEIWAQLSSSKEQVSDSFPCTITSKATLDHWTNVSIVINEALPKDWYLAGTTDIVLLRHRENRTKSALALVKESKSKPRHETGLTAVLQFCFDENCPDPGLQINSTWTISKVMSLSTALREHGALVTLDSYENNDVIYRPRLALPPIIDSKAVQKTMETYMLNEPQAKAIESSLASEGFVLIQGPPGTGKTSTICGLVSAATGRRPRPISGQRAPPPPKILICAPSNAAIDEITYRLKEGYRGSVKSENPLKVVRIGASVGESVRDVEINYLVDQALGLGAPDDRRTMDANLGAIREELRQVGEASRQMLEEMESTHDNAARVVALREQHKQLTIKRTTLREQLKKKDEERRDGVKARDTARRSAQAQIMQNAQVYCTTLSGAGHKMLQENNPEFDLIIIDEAAQAVELATLVPLRFAAQRCVLVGDPNQLPPTVLSGVATKFRYNQSLFVRMQKRNPQAVHLLSIQYRMHPEISVLPSRLFYDGRLTDGPDMATKTAQNWHNDPKFGVYRVFNVAGNEENSPGKSMKNSNEAQMVLLLYNRLLGRLGLNARVGVISPYRGQIAELRNVFLKRYGRDIFERVTFNTVDGFQGQEKDVIILSTVRAGPGVKSIGFLNDTRRMNVALTRAKSSVFVVGNTPTLERGDHMWKRIIEDARARSLLVDANAKYFTEASNASYVAPQPTKKAAKVLPPPPPPPADLQTPRQVAEKSHSDGSRIAGGIKRKLSDTAEPRPGPSTRPPPSINNTSPAPDPRSAVDYRDSRPPTGQPSRPAQHPQPTNSLPPKPQAPNHPNPNQPKKKKPKGSNLFIPKKQEKKRPPDGDAGAGPSVKRKLA